MYCICTKLKNTLLIFSKHHIVLIKVSSCYKHSTVEFLKTQCTLCKIRKILKIFISLRIALGKGYQIESHMFTILNSNSHHCFPMKPKASHVSHPLRPQYITSRQEGAFCPVSTPGVPSFSDHG